MWEAVPGAWKRPSDDVVVWMTGCSCPIYPLPGHSSVAIEVIKVCVHQMSISTELTPDKPLATYHALTQRPPIISLPPHLCINELRIIRQPGAVRPARLAQTAACLQ